MNITVIGAGNMGGAMARGWARKGRVSLAVANRSLSRLERLAQEYPSIATFTDNAEAASCADIVVVAVKPWLVADVVAQVLPAMRADALLVSVAAGVGTEALLRMAPERRVAYAIPNIAAEWGESITFVHALDPADELTDALRDLGQVMELPDDATVNAAMKVGSCGIAYALRFIHALAQGGTQLGMRPADALDAAAATLAGAAAVMRHSGLHPEQAIDTVTTPGGFTIRGLNAMEAAGFTPSVMAGLTFPDK